MHIIIWLQILIKLLDKGVVLLEHAIKSSITKHHTLEILKVRDVETWLQMPYNSIKPTWELILLMMIHDGRERADISDKTKDCIVQYRMVYYIYTDEKVACEETHRI